MPEVPFLDGILSADDVAHTARSIASVQEDSGAVPWFPGGHVDPWDHVESAMALSATGLFAEADAAYEWSRRTQRTDGSWPIQIRTGAIEDAGSDSNFCAYIAVGVWHHVLITDDDGFARRMWPCVRAALEFVLGLQRERGEIEWGRDVDGNSTGEALLSGCSSIHQSLRCGLALAELAGSPQPDLEVALGQLGHVVRGHPELFAAKRRYSMDWYYPVLGGAVRGEQGLRRITERWNEFVVPRWGARCVDDRPWVTGGETCELVLSLDALGERVRARELLAVIQHLREQDGSYWTGYVYEDDKRWPVERTTWTGASVILAADALSRTTPGNGIFRAEDLPSGLAVEAAACDCAADLRR